MSEIAEIRKRIDQEIAAMRQGFEGYAVVAKHRKVDNAYDGIGQFIHTIIPFVGYEAAMMMKDLVAGFSALKMLYTDQGKDEQEFTSLLDKLPHEWEDLQSCIKFFVFFGQKPA